MSLKEAKIVDKNLYELKIEIDPGTFAEAVDKIYKKRAKNITVPGFRRGKAPRSIVEKMYGKGVFYEDAINDLLPSAWADALKESGIAAVSQPDFSIDSVDESGVALTAKVYVKPEVSIEGYKGIEVTRTVEPTTDSEVQEEIDRVRDRNARMIDVTDRAAENGDTANIDFEGFVDGKAFEGGKAEGHELILGSGQFIPGFEEQIVGKSIGDSFDVNVTFPAEYHAEDLAGKAAVFKVKLNALRRKELPALDDEFAKDVSDFDTFAAYEADVRANITSRKEKAADAAVEDQLIDALIEKLDADIPEAMFVNETENFVRDYDTRLRMQGLDLAKYFQYTGMDLDGLRAQMRPQAEKQVKTRLALEKIAQLENIDVTEEELEAEYTRLAEAYNMESDKIKESIEADALSEDIKVKKAVDLVKEAAVIKTEAPKKAPAKKAPAKAKAASADTEAKMEAKAPAKTTAKKTTAAKSDSADKAAAPKKAAAAKTSTATKSTTTTTKKTAGSTAAKSTAAKKPAAKKATPKKTETDKTE
ncbi:MAG: trigger factor [Clostridiales bacterium]|nr:trigger factor [Clostridiales bacterium]